MKELKTNKNKENFLRCLIKIDVFKKIFNEMVNKEVKLLDKRREVRKCILAREMLWWTL